MVRPYSLDLRERVVARVETGASCHEVAELFGLSASSVIKWARRKRELGSAAAKPMGGSRGRRLSGERAWLLRRIETKPDITLRGLLAELAERGLKVSSGAIWDFFASEGIRFKKKPARQRARQARRRKTSRPMEEVSR